MQARGSLPDYQNWIRCCIGLLFGLVIESDISPLLVEIFIGIFGRDFKVLGSFTFLIN